MRSLLIAFLMVSVGCDGDGKNSEKSRPGDEVAENPIGGGASGNGQSETPGGNGPDDGDNPSPPPNNGMFPDDQDEESPRDRPDYDPLDCPFSEPRQGQACGDGYLLCTYGDSPRFDCRAVLECIEGKWESRPTTCDAVKCPAAIPTKDVVCKLINDPREDQRAPCAYRRTLCYCSSCPFGDCQSQQGWECTEQTDRECPGIQPNQGDACDDQGKGCSYGYPCEGGGQWICRRGAWFRVLEECDD